MKKYILLLVSVFAFGQDPNQMVSFTEAQSLGFSLKSGQSHVTSNQCMTKSEALAKYNVDASAMSSYANNQLVPRSVWFNAVPSYYHFVAGSFSTRAEACDYDNDYIALYTSSSTIENGIHFFTNSSLTTQFHGTGSFYISEGKTFQINGAGGVANIINCPPPVGVYTHLIGSNGFSDSSIGCVDVPEEVTRYSNDNILTIGSILYTDVKLTTVFNGFGQWFKISGNLMAHILTSGEIANIIDCSPGETVSSYTYMISKGTDPYGITIDASGNIYTANIISDNVTKITQ